MIESAISREALNELPEYVQEKLEEGGLRATLESLIDVLHNDETLADDDAVFLIGLLERTIAVLARACEPLTVVTFERLRNAAQSAVSAAQSQDRQSFRTYVADYLQLLSAVPTMWPEYEVAVAQSLSDDLLRARRRLRRSDTNLKNAYQQSQVSLQEEFQDRQASLVNEYRQAEETLRTEVNETRNNLTATYAETQRALTDGFNETISSLQRDYTETHESLEAAFDTNMSSLSDATERAREQASSAVDDVVEYRNTADTLVSELRKLLGIASDMSWGATYDASAERDERSAYWLRIVSFVLYILAAGLGVALLVWNIGSETGDFSWLPRFFIGGPVIILVWAAVYAARESGEHRNSSRLFRHQALAFISLDKYASRIADVGNVGGGGDSKAAEFLEAISKSLFTNQIDAHVEQVKAQGRGGRVMMRRFWQRSEK